MKYVFLGGAGEVGASCLLIQVADRNILIDCGVRVNQQGRNSLPDLDRLKELAPTLDAIFISHAHADHVGALPLVHKMYPGVRICSTTPTVSLADIMLKNALSVMKANDVVIFQAEDVEMTIQQMSQSMLLAEKWYPLWDEWQIKFIYSGHIYGAVSILLDTPEGRFLYSGDVSAFNQKTIDGIRDLSDINADFMWCEATYGDGNHPSRTAEEQKLAKAVASIIKDGGKVLIPSFALGRAQEIILILRQAMESQVIPTFPVFTDGLINLICRNYEHNAVHSDGLGTKFRRLKTHSVKKGESVFFSKHVRAVRSRDRETLIKDRKPKCIIASSGMITGGASVAWAKALAGSEHNAIFLSGYQDAESPGRRLQELQQGDELVFADGTSVSAKCQVQRFHLSAHSDQGQLIKMIKQVNPKRLALLHGELPAITALKNKIYPSYPASIAVIGEVEDTIEKDFHDSQRKTRTNQFMIGNKSVSIEMQADQIHSIKVDMDPTEIKRWHRFSKGEHSVELKGNKLIIQRNSVI